MLQDTLVFPVIAALLGFTGFCRYSRVDRGAVVHAVSDAGGDRVFPASQLIGANLFSQQHGKPLE